MNELTQALQENWAIIAPVLILQAILMVVALIDCFKHDKTNGPQWIWVLVIVFINIIGPILYFVFGRRND
ncbi:PLD nuclease N-terminal domain-containing protein [Salipaludibacillus aurantiacus]|uniref:Phospholipase_D-nuclease N-terminal n=1 Tax=Salipaludibacillus aurantiacus TaxID=1601833 RepID=A0A1H9WI48_9BACI|nr:PLD nuclease N-terminal domain-containing protein [Salipaludibacillus aurantiacus]SES33419.1 Phospholipase_D-nuclease N-terminal [Salipaludibacillus aurantiacus]